MSGNKITLLICSWKQPIQLPLLENGEINLKSQARSLRPLVKWLGLNLMGMGLLLGLLVPLPVLAANYECTEAGLDAALAAGDMAATFNCVGPTTITITTPKVVTQDTGLDGDGLLTISGGDSLRVFSVTTGITLNLNDITISNGRVISDNGGAIYNNGTLILNNSSVVSSTAVGDTPRGSNLNCVGGDTLGCGGGILNNGVAVINHSVVASNTAVNSGVIFHGGGHGGGVANFGTLTVTDSIFRNNVGDGYPGGGGILSLNILSIRGSQFIDNRALVGGGVEPLGGQASISTSTFISNVAYQLGGGIYDAADNVIVTSSVFTGNVASDSGGAVYIHPARVFFRDSTFSHNRALNGGGGGIYVNYGYVTVVNSTFVSNTAPGGGGSLHAVAGDDFVRIELTNTLVAGGSASHCNSRVISLGYNLDDGDTCNLTATGDITNTNPLLGPLQDNGGATLTHALLAGSPAIDAGDNTNCTSTDQRGVTRPQNGTCDIGAYEVAVVTPLTLTSLNPFSATVGDTGFTLTLTGTDFVSGAVVLWNGSTRSTTYVNSTQLTASIPASDLTAAGTVSVSVRNPDNQESNELSFTTNRANTTTTVGSSLNPSQFGQTVTFTATVSSSGGTPTGTVTFRDDGTELGTSNLADGTATLAISTLGAGSHPITAEYNGNTNFSSSIGTLTGGQTVSRASTTTTVGSSLNPSQFGQTVTFTATVSSGGGTPTGTVTFRDDGTELGTSNLADGAATLAISTLGAGSHPITAEYNGNTNFSSSPGTLTGGQVVTQAGQTITFAPLASRAVGDPPFSVTATASSGLAVSFTAAGNCTVAGDLVTITEVGSCTITAHQVGNTNYNPALDVSQSFTISANSDDPNKIYLPLIIK